MSVVSESQPSTSTQRHNRARVIVLDTIADEGLAKLDSADEIEYEVRTGLSGPELRDALAQFDGAVCRSGVKITAEALENNQTLKAIVRAGVGTDNIDKQAATRLGIVVMNTPGGNTVSTAEHTMALMLGLSRNLAPAHASLVGGNWDRKKFSGTQLHGKTLGIIGLGRIGQEVGGRSKAFGMNIVGYDPFLPNDQISSLGFAAADSIEQLLSQVDYLTVHTPLTPETKGLIGTAQIGQMKKGVRLINCARGGIYDEAALVEGLKSGHLGGVALDVYQTEPCINSPLFQIPNVLCTPHLGASTEEAQIQVAEEAVDLLVNFLRTGEVRQAVNTIAIDPQQLKSMQGYFDVAYRLGVMLGQWHGGAIDDCQLEFQGEIAEQDTRSLAAAFCAGLLQHISDHANIINAELLCRDRGIEVARQQTPRHGAFNSVISATVNGEGKELQAAGTVFGKNMPRLVRLGDYRTEAYLDGILLIFTHHDIPGIIGYVGQVLADEKVNIAQMAVGRRQPGGQAIGVLNLDNSASKAAVSKVIEHQAIKSADLIQLPLIGQYPDWLA